MTGVEPYSLGVDAEAAAGTLARAVQFRTVSDDLSRPDFPAFLAFLDETFPRVTAATEKVVLEANTPLYKWQGSDDSLPPVLLAAHYDVVPIPPGSLERWDYDPFAGEIADGYVWGRGTLDNKGALIALLTAAETLVGQGFAPKRTIYFSFGGDEEIGGTGAKAVAAYLNGQGVKLAWALDEGSFVLDGIIPGLDQPVASINLSEKGYMTARLVATGAGGHSSMPPRVTAVGELAGALDRLQKAPVPGGLTDVSATFFDTLGRYFPFGQRIVAQAQKVLEESASIKEIAKNATDAARVADEAVSIAEGTNTTISSLGTSSAEIGKVIKVITGIAQQTNLLALNATIEAARAGDAGRGFAVVANEVKELAKETGRATEDIGQKIEAIQVDVKGAIEGIARISEVIHHISQVQGSIASAVEEQTITTNEMGRRVADAAKEVAGNIGGVAEAAKSTNAGVDSMRQAATDLAKLAADLQTLVVDAERTGRADNQK